MRGLDLSRPDTLYIGIWGCVVLLAMFVPLAYIEPINNIILFIVCFNILSFTLIYKFLCVFLNPKNVFLNPFDDVKEVYVLARFIKKIFPWWFAGYLINIIASGGLPFFWLLTGDAKTYADYGLPTFSGFLNMMRAFIFVASILVYIKGKNYLYLFIAIGLLLSTILEISRGGISVLLLHGIAVWVMHKKFKFLKIMLALGLFILFIIGFGELAEMRGHGVNVESMVGDFDLFLKLPTGFFWVYTYLVSPFNNLNYASNAGFEPLYAPFFSLQALIPSVIRTSLFTPEEYPISLASDAFNATSYYGPLLADFGYVGAVFVVCIIQFVTAYTHIKAKSGDAYYYLVYPALFMCVVMSVFYSYIFSMIVVMYPLLSALYMRYRKRYY